MNQPDTASMETSNIFAEADAILNIPGQNLVSSHSAYREEDNGIDKDSSIVET